MKITLRVAGLVALVCPVLASAQARVVIGPIKGDRGGVLSRQLTKEVCAQLDCAPKSSAYTGIRPDFAKARRQHVSGILYGAVKGAGAKRQLWLALLTTSKKPARTWKSGLRSNGLLSQSALDGIVGDVSARVEPPPAPTRPPPAITRAPPAISRAPATLPPLAAPRTAEPLDYPEPAPAASAAAPVPVAPPPPPQSPAFDEPPPASDAARERTGWAAVELGGYVTSRDLSFSGAGSGTLTLQAMSASAILGPRLALEVYPAAPFTQGLLSGVGGFVDYRMSVGFKVKSAGETHATSTSQLGIGVKWALPPLTGLKLRIAPALSYERRDVKVSGSIPGLADTHLGGVKVGAGLSVPIVSRYTLLLGGGYVLWSSAGDLAKTNGEFFPSGKANALELEAGLAVALTGPFSARLVGEYSSTSYTLDPDPTGRYVATGATDRWLGARMSVRADF